ncbi:MAG: hypothetical protein WC764_02130 [Candidatus Paceibacterota bacterium]|jgi:hypothetical protein
MAQEHMQEGLVNSENEVLKQRMLEMIEGIAHKLVRKRSVEVA